MKHLGGVGLVALDDGHLADLALVRLVHQAVADREGEHVLASSGPAVVVGAVVAVVDGAVEVVASSGATVVSVVSLSSSSEPEPKRARAGAQDDQGDDQQAHDEGDRARATPTGPGVTAELPE